MYWSYEASLEIGRTRALGRNDVWAREEGEMIRKRRVHKGRK